MYAIAPNAECEHCKGFGKETFILCGLLYKILIFCTAIRSAVSLGVEHYRSCCWVKEEKPWAHMVIPGRCRLLCDDLMDSNKGLRWMRGLESSLL